MPDTQTASTRLTADVILYLRVKITPPLRVGPTGQGTLQVIPIVGGTVWGPLLNGTVVSGGADWNTARDDGLAHVFAKYLLQADDGAYIAIENEGVFDPTREAVIKTRPTFAVDVNGKYRELNHGVYVGELATTPGAQDSVDITIYRLR